MFTVRNLRLSLLLVTLSTSVSMAGTKPTACPTLAYDPFPVHSVTIEKTYDPGAKWTKANSDGPDPGDYPPNVQLTIKDPAFKSADATTIIVYNIANVYSTPNKTIQPQIALLKKLLADRPTKLPADKSSANGVELDLPDYPASDCMHLVQAKLHYIDCPWGSALGFVTVFAQDIAPPTNNDLSYVFQGLSKDGKYYVSATIHITHPKLAATYDDVPAKDRSDGKAIDQFNAKIFTILKSAANSDYHPSLTTLDEWLSALKFK